MPSPILWPALVMQLASIARPLPASVNLLDRVEHDCRILETPLSQGECGACSAFAVSAWMAIRRCIDEGVDEVPSPYRIFDCAGGTCAQGASLGAVVVVAAGRVVPDMNTSEPAFLGEASCGALAHRSRYALFLAYQTHRDAIRHALWWWGPLLGTVSGWEGANATRPHAVVVIGWTRDGWLIQNSWGDAWGDATGRGVIPWHKLNYGLRPLFYDGTQRWLMMALVALTLTGALWSAMAPLAGREEFKQARGEKGEP